jgi:hypothetical protein
VHKALTHAGLMRVRPCEDACADVNVHSGAVHRLQSMNWQETLFMASEGQLLDETFSLMSLTSLFTRTNALAEQTGDDEDGLGELNFTEVHKAPCL